MEERPVRIRDIAEELGLSTATVSNVLHGKTGKVSDETVRRVEAALEERQYIPSMAGLLLAQNDSRIIGVVVNDHEKYEGRTLEDVYVSAALNSLSTGIEALGRFMMVKKTRDPDSIIRFASMWNMEGLVLMGFCDGDYAYLRSHMRIPFVMYDGYCRETEGICNITSDHYDGGYQVGRHFRLLGHRRALCVADNRVCVDKERFEGFLAGFRPGAGELLEVPMKREARERFLAERLETLRGYTAVFAVSDQYALELLRFFQSRGIRVPEDVSVAGFDDTPMCALACPSLTSVRQDMDIRAETALSKLMALKKREPAGNGMVLPVTLVVRESTAPPRRPD